MPEPLSWFAVLFAAVFTNNILLTNYLGMCSFLGASREVRTSMGLGAAVLFVLTATSALNWIVYHHALVPLGLVHLRFIVFIVVIAAFTQIVEMTIDRLSARLYAALGIFLPLITVNCAILGGSLFMYERSYSLPQSVVYGFSSGVGWALAIVSMAAIRKKIRYSNVPAGLRGLGITMILTGLMAMAFMIFSGIDL